MNAGVLVWIMRFVSVVVRLMAMSEIILEGLHVVVWMFSFFVFIRLHVVAVLSGIGSGRPITVKGILGPLSYV